MMTDLRKTSALNEHCEFSEATFFSERERVRNQNMDALLRGKREK